MAVEQVPAQREEYIEHSRKVGGRGQPSGLLAGQDSREVVTVKEQCLLYTLMSVPPTRL